MERLTRQETIMVGGKEMAACNYKNDDCNDSCMYGNCRWQEKANMLLKEYEDTDLTPEQIREMQELLSRENTTEIARSSRDTDVLIALEVLDKLSFFGGQRAGRELWNDKSRKVQDEDIASFNQNIEYLRDLIRKHMNDGWIPVEERLPEKNEYFVDTSSNKEFPNGYYRRLEIAYMTDTVEYIHGYYDGYKWMDEYLDAIKNVVAWRIHEPYRPERSSDEKE